MKVVALADREYSVQRLLFRWHRRGLVGSLRHVGGVVLLVGLLAWLGCLVSAGRHLFAAMLLFLLHFLVVRNVSGIGHMAFDS